MLSSARAKEEDGPARSVGFVVVIDMQALVENLSLGPAVSYHCDGCGSEGGKLERETHVDCWNCGRRVA